MTQASQQLQIIAEPKAFCRERYGSEQYKTGNRVQRYIRAEDNKFRFEYPTIKIPGRWYDITHQLYIRIVSVTVPNKNVSAVCVHPYPIDTDDLNVHKDPANNALYFPITNDDFMNGRKSFLLTRRKLVQKELKLHGPLRILDSDQRHVPCITNKSRSKQLIKIYELWKWQFVFSGAEYVDKNVFNLFSDSSVSSQVMSNEIGPQQDDDLAVSVVAKNDHDEKCVICVPERGSWAGGDNVLMVLTKLDRRKAFRIYFDYAESNEKKYIQYELVDMKTIAFRTPSCLMEPSDQNQTVPVVAIQGEKVIGKFNFLYLSPNTVSTVNVCSFCELRASSDVVRPTMSNKRSCPSFDDLFVHLEADSQ